jgi:hypothetical protein
MSLGGGFVAGDADAVARMTTKGVFVAVAAGNSSRGRLPLVAGERRVGGDRRRIDAQRRARVLLELGNLRRPVRSRLEHHLRLVREQHAAQHDQRHAHGLAPRGGRGGAPPAGEPGRLGLGRDQRHPGRHDAPTWITGNRRGTPNRLLFTSY